MGFVKQSENMTQLLLLIYINLHPNEYSEGVDYYTFAFKLGRCVGNCNFLNELSNKIYVPNKIEDLNLSLFKMITGINESKTLTKRIAQMCM